MMDALFSGFCESSLSTFLRVVVLIAVSNWSSSSPAICSWTGKLGSVDHPAPYVRPCGARFRSRGTRPRPLRICANGSSPRRSEAPFWADQVVQVLATGTFPPVEEVATASARANRTRQAHIHLNFKSGSCAAYIVSSSLSLPLGISSLRRFVIRFSST
jgi:hypothetical protein